MTLWSGLTSLVFNELWNISMTLAWWRVGWWAASISVVLVSWMNLPFWRSNEYMWWRLQTTSYYNNTSDVHSFTHHVRELPDVNGGGGNWQPSLYRIYRSMISPMLEKPPHNQIRIQCSIIHRYVIGWWCIKPSGASVDVSTWSNGYGGGILMGIPIDLGHRIDVRTPGLPLAVIILTVLIGQRHHEREIPRQIQLGAAWSRNSSEVSMATWRVRYCGLLLSIGGYVFLADGSLIYCLFFDKSNTITKYAFPKQLNNVFFSCISWTISKIV